jgi:hypothetical protein
MKYAVEMGLVAMIYIPSFMEGGGGVHRQDGNRISLLSFFFCKRSRLKRKLRFIVNVYKGELFCPCCEICAFTEQVANGLRPVSQRACSASRATGHYGTLLWVRTFVQFSGY